MSPVVGDLSPQIIAESYAHPLWMVKRWTEQYSLELTQKICEHDQSIPQTSLRLRSPNVETELAAQGISLVPGKVLASARRVTAGDVTKSESFRTGRVLIQDEGSQLVAALIGAGHERILDCCAAPGGKTLAIADQNPGASIIAVEIHPHRARIMRTLLGKDVNRIRILNADARHLPLAQVFDRILVDAPCSGTGTLGRTPEIKWRLKIEDLAELRDRQLAILRSAAQHLRPRGRVIYSTCSLEKEENEVVVEQLLREEPGLHLRDCREELDRLKTTGSLTWPDPNSLVRGGPYLRTIPGIHPCDGFFAAIIERL
jgi:16S rRNA (cytosine967-C5)-methyltransferase